MSMSPLETGGIPVFALAIGIRIKIPYCRYYGESLSIEAETKPIRWNSDLWNTSIYIRPMGI